MDLEMVLLGNYIRERQISYDITYMWNLKNDTNEPIYKTDVENNLMVTRGKRWGERGEINWEIGIEIYTLLYIK